jgi:hypothetical protein
MMRALYQKMAGLIRKFIFVDKFREFTYSPPVGLLSGPSSKELYLTRRINEKAFNLASDPGVFRPAHQ